MGKQRGLNKSQKKNKKIDVVVDPGPDEPIVDEDGNYICIDRYPNCLGDDYEKIRDKSLSAIMSQGSREEGDEDSEEESDYGGFGGCTGRAKEQETLIGAPKPEMTKKEKKKEEKRQARIKGIGKTGGVCATGSEKSCCLIF